MQKKTLIKKFKNHLKEKPINAKKDKIQKNINNLFNT